METEIAQQWQRKNDHTQVEIKDRMFHQGEWWIHVATTNAARRGTWWVREASFTRRYYQLVRAS